MQTQMGIGRVAVLGVVAAMALSGLAGPAEATSSLPIEWTAGGQSAGTDSAGQAARLTSDPAGNVAVVSGPAYGRYLAVTSYTSAGDRRWRRTVAPTSGTFAGDWVVAATNGDLVAVGHNVTSSGQPIGLTMVRYSFDGMRQWRKDLPGTLPSVGRLVVDDAGSAYLAYNALGDGQDIHLVKYSPAGELVWSSVVATDPVANDIATSLALGPNGSDIVLTGDVIGGATWITASYNTTTGARRWLVTAAEGTAARDVVVSSDRVYVTGQGAVGTESYATVVAYARATGARLWRTDSRPATNSAGTAGLRIARTSDGVVVAGQTGVGLDWWTISVTSSGTVRWTARRDERSDWDEVPTAVLAVADGTTVVTGPGGPALPGGYVQGVTAGYSADGTLLWEAFSPLTTVWATLLPNRRICAAGGYDALVTCWRVPRGTPPPPADS